MRSWSVSGRPYLMAILFSNLLAAFLVTTFCSDVTASVNMPDANPSFLDGERLRVFASSDVPQETVDGMIRDTKDAYSVWMRRNYYGKNQAKAIYLNIPGSDLAASELAYARYCEHIEAVGLPYQPLCLPDAKYLRYVDDGGGSINSDARYGFWAYFMGAKFGNQRTTAFHEVFHIYQMTNIFTDEPCCSNFPDVDSKMGQRTGDDPNKNVIWWSEGNATFFGYLHGSANSTEFKSNMRDLLESDSTYSVSNKAEYLNRGTKLYNIPYGRDDTGLGYDIGAWFSAYVTFNHGEEKIYRVWETTDQKGFVTAFSEVFGKGYREVIEDFDIWLVQNNEDLLEILDGIYEASPSVIEDLNAETRFIERFYMNILGRPADEAGLGDWLDVINTQSASAVALGFFNSVEFKNKELDDAAFVDTLYRTLFYRAGDEDGTSYWLQQLSSGKLRDMVIWGFLRAEEFQTLSGSLGVTAVTAADDSSFGVRALIERLYTVVLKRQPDQAGFDGWVSALSAKTLSGGDIAKAFLLSEEYIGRNTTNREFVDATYQAFFGRDADEAGKQGWLDLLSGGQSRESVLEGFIDSAEFAALGILWH